MLNKISIFFNVCKRFVNVFSKFLLLISISFLLGVAWNDLTESSSIFESLNSKGIGLTHTTSFQFDLSINSFLIILITTIFVVYFYTFSRKVPKKILLLEIMFFSFIKGLNVFTFYKIAEEFNEITFLLFLVFILIMDGIVGDEITDEVVGKMEDTPSKKLLTSRKKDLFFIKDALENFNIIGIEGEWGEGKTFLVEKLIEDIKVNTNESIIINTLNLEKEELLPLVLKQLDKILLKYRIIPIGSRNLKSFMSNQTFLGINFNGLLSTLTHKEALEEYKKNFERLNKVVYIFFDDIDRDLDEVKIKTALNIGAEFNEKNIKFIYLYSEEILKERKLDRNYLEKYIPKSYKLTPIDFLELFNIKFNEYKNIKKSSNLKMENFKWLKELFRTYSQSYDNRTNRREDLKTFIEISDLLSGDIKLNIDTLSPRKVENFIEEVDLLINYKEKEKLEIENRLIIAISFIKVYYYDCYKMFFKMNKLEETFPIELKRENNSTNIVTLEELQKVDKLLNMDKLLFQSSKIKVNNSWMTKKNVKEIMEKFGLGVEYEDIKEKWENERLQDFERGNLKIKGYENLTLDGDDTNENYGVCFIIHSLINYPLYTSKSRISTLHKRDKINNNIRKLVKIGEKRYLSKYELYYKYLNKIFEIVDIEKRKKKYNYIWEDEKNDSEYEYFHYFGKETVNIIELISKKVMEDLKKYLEILFSEKEINDFLIEILGDQRILREKVLRAKIVSELLKKNVMSIEDPIRSETLINFIKIFFTKFAEENGSQNYLFFETFVTKENEKEHVNNVMKSIIDDIKKKKIYKLKSKGMEVEQIEKFANWLSQQLNNSSKKNDNFRTEITTDILPKIKVIIEEVEDKSQGEIYKILDEKLLKDELKGWEVEAIIKELDLA